MASKETFYEGKRLSYDGALCTVRYQGSLAGTKGSWLGVEWDDTSRGKHNGTHQGQRTFSCITKSTTAASFVRPTRPTDRPRSFLEALRFKYGGKIILGKSVKPVEISGKTVEEIGFDKIRRQQAELQDLRVAVLDELQLCGIKIEPHTSGSLRRAQDDIAQTCPNIIELDLGWSLLEKWQDVADICRPLQKLRILKVSGIRLRSFSVQMEQDSASAFAGVQEVYLDETLLRPPQLAEMLNNHFPKLKTLSLAENELDSLTSIATFCKPYLPTLSSLVLERNSFRDLEPLMSISMAFPNLVELSLQQNKIEVIGNINPKETVTLDMFRNLRSLNLSRNLIKDFLFVDLLALLFPSLASLRISNNPLWITASAAPSAAPTETPRARSDVPYSFTLARIPTLTVLNHTTITARDREEGEIYYISATGKEIAALLEGPNDSNDAGHIATKIQVAKAKHPQYEGLCSKYDRESVFEQYSEGFDKARSADTNHKVPAGSLAARLVNAKFYVPGSPDKVLQRPIARTIDVYRVKALISREMGLRPLQFRLVYESEELDPIRDGFEQTSSDWEAWGDWDVDGDSESDKESLLTHQHTHKTWTNGVLLEDGKKWKKREVEILDGTKAWGDYIGDDEVKSVNIRVEPYETH